MEATEARLKRLKNELAKEIVREARTYAKNFGYTIAALDRNTPTVNLESKAISVSVSNKQLSIKRALRYFEKVKIACKVLAELDARGIAWRKPREKRNAE